MRVSVAPPLGAKGLIASVTVANVMVANFMVANVMSLAPLHRCRTAMANISFDFVGPPQVLSIRLLPREAVLLVRWLKF